MYILLYFTCLLALFPQAASSTLAAAAVVVRFTLSLTVFTIFTVFAQLRENEREDDDDTGESEVNSTGLLIFKISGYGLKVH